MKKTLVTFIITVLILMVCITTVQALSFGVKITPSATDVKKGESVTLIVGVNNLDVGANGLNTFLATIEYDKNVFNTLTTDNVKEKSWLELIYAISNFNKLFYTWNFYIKIELILLWKIFLKNLINNIYRIIF